MNQNIYVNESFGITIKCLHHFSLIGWKADEGQARDVNHDIYLLNPSSGDGAPPAHCPRVAPHHCLDTVLRHTLCTPHCTRHIRTRDTPIFASICKFCMSAVCLMLKELQSHGVCAIFAMYRF